MNNNDVFDRNTKSNFVNNLNTSISNNDKQRLQDNLNSTNISNTDLNNTLSDIKTDNISTNVGKNNQNIVRNINTARLNNNINNAKKNNRMSNKLSSNGNTSIRKNNPISDNLMNNKLNHNALNTAKVKGSSNFLNKLMGKDTSEIEEQTAGQGFQQFVIPKKVKKWLLIITPAALTIIVFCCLIISASQIILNSMTLGHADSLSDSRAEGLIDKMVEDGDLDEEMTDEKLEEIENELGYVSISYNKNSIFNAKLGLVNIVPVLTTSSSKTNLNELKDYYPSIGNYSSGEYDMDIVYAFFYKLMYIERYYKNNYNVQLDMPLLMATLRLQSTDMGDVFTYNVEDYDVSLKVNNPLFAHDYDWSGYITNKTSSKHDIEVLVQHMVTTTSGSCSTSTGYCYKIDESAYKEFLKEFLEKKYFINNNESAIGQLGINGNSYNSNDESKKDGNYVSDVIYYDSGFGNVVYYNQYDYANYYYSKDPSKAEYYQNGKAATIGSHGCGPTSLAIVLSSLLNKEITPIETTSKVCLDGGCTSGGSYAYKLVKVAKDYGLNVVETSNNQEVINALNSNNSLVIVLMGPGTFTRGGHYIVLTGSNSSGQVSVADSASRERTNQKWFSFNTVVEQRNTNASYMIFSR